MRFALDGGRIEVVPAAEVQARSLPSPSLASFSVRVDEIETVAKLLREEEILFSASSEGIVQVSTLLFGVELSFTATGCV